ncbi:MAG TPA: AMP-binding protein, partial [Longimicrobium sp.]|nr:AMP-binding protein [Longimicrobium sp.]
MTNATPVRSRPPLSDDRREPLARTFTRDASLGALFAEVARAHPHAEALAWPGGRLSYAELDARANRLARHLRSLGVRPGDRVGISLARWPELGVALLAAVKAGASYVPLDAEYPAERLAFMRRDSKIVALVVARAEEARLEAGESVRVVALDEARAAIAALPAEAPETFACGESEAY